jgi:(p)ppGpp synthase/HD superfamily hydrolase
MAQFTDTPIISDRFANAVLLALHWHKKQIRKNGTPYMSHLMQVAGLVLEHNGTEDEAIAAILHDSVEDLSIKS